MTLLQRIEKSFTKTTVKVSEIMLLVAFFVIIVRIIKSLFLEDTDRRKYIRMLSVQVRTIYTIRIAFSLRRKSARLWRWRKVGIVTVLVLMLYPIYLYCL